MKIKADHSQNVGRKIFQATQLFLSALSPAFALLTFGCAVPRSADYRPNQVPACVAPPGRIGLAYGGPLPQFDLQIPDTRAEAAEEHAVKVGWSWARDLHEGIIPLNEAEEAVLCVRMGLTPVGMLGGAVYGAFAGESKSKLEPALTALTNAMTELQVQEALRQKLLLLVQQKSPRPVNIMTNSFPAETAFRLHSLMDDYVPLPSDTRMRSECNPASFEGIDTLLMIRVINHGLSGLDGHNSRLALNMSVRVTLVRAQDQAQLSGFYAQYDSPARKFVDWAANGAEPFRSEFEWAVQNLAEQIVAQSGLQLPPPPPAAMSIVRNP